MIEDNTVVTRTVERHEVNKAAVDVHIKVGHADHRVADELADRIAINVKNTLGDGDGE